MSETETYNISLTCGAAYSYLYKNMLLQISLSKSVSLQTQYTVLGQFPVVTPARLV
jgi:hypothetical protein